jgi:hypothetical protein
VLASFAVGFLKILAADPELKRASQCIQSTANDWLPVSALYGGKVLNLNKAG